MRADGLDAGSYVKIKGYKSVYTIEVISGFSVLLKNTKTGKIRKNWLPTRKIVKINKPVEKSSSKRNLGDGPCRCLNGSYRIAYSYINKGYTIQCYTCFKYVTAEVAKHISHL